MVHHSRALWGAATAPCCWQAKQVHFSKLCKTGRGQAGVLHHSASCLSARGHKCMMQQVQSKGSSDRTGCTAQPNLGRETHTTTPKSLDVCVARPSLAKRSLTLSIPIVSWPCQHTSQAGATHTTQPSKAPSGQQQVVPGSRQNCCSLCWGQLNNQGIQTTGARSQPNCPNQNRSCLWTAAAAPACQISGCC